MMVCFMTWMMIRLISKVKEVSENPKVSDLTFCNCPVSNSSRPLDKSTKTHLYSDSLDHKYRRDFEFKTIDTVVHK